MAKKTAQEILALATGINEPQVDWVPLWKAPFFCFSDGYITSPNEWKRALLAKVQQGITSKYPIDDGVPPLVDDLPPPEWSFSKNSAKAEITIRGMGITTIISPQGGFIFPGERFDIRDWHIAGSSNDMFKDSDWHRIRPDERTGARWHRRLLLGLFGNNFVQAVKLGTVHIMARKNSALAAFERITWDQWQFFRLDEKNDRWPRIWYDPRELYLRDVPDAATGPAGEQFYAIYVAPGLETKTNLTVEEKCRQWLVELLREYPIRPPLPLHRLAKEATSKFPGLSKRAFERCYFSAQMETQNKNWSLPGRHEAPPKSPQESPHKK